MGKFNYNSTKLLSIKLERMIMNTMGKAAVVSATLIATLALSSTASAFWNPKDWDMKDGWGKGGNSPMAPMGWGSNDKRGPFGGENGWGAVDSMMDNMGMGDAMSDLNTDVEWDLNMDTKLKGKASGEAKGSGKSNNRARGKARSDVRHSGDNYYAPYAPNPYFNAPQAVAPAPYGAAPYGYGAAPYYPYGPMMGPNSGGVPMMPPMGGAAPFAPAMPQMMAPPQQFWRR
jgi:hypothetical protein